LETIGTPFLWTSFAVFTAACLAVDFFTLRQQGAHRVSFREAIIWTIIWILVWLVYAGWLWWELGGLAGDPIAHTKTVEFMAGYLIERALAVDNMFVFLMIFMYFNVRPEDQKRALMIGILVAMVLRAIMIFAGAWLIASFHWLLYLFGAFLIVTGIKMWGSSAEPADLESNFALRMLRKLLRVADGYDGERFFTRVNGVLMATPMLIVILFIGIIDIVFAVDSIPAIFAITTDPFIVLTSNIFAILGLRALFFVLVSAQSKFHLLNYGLSVILVLIGIKMVIMDFYKISVSLALLVTVAVLTVTMVLSIIIPPKPANVSSD
jgi:tellurite resistance protein TerC